MTRFAAAEHDGLSVRLNTDINPSDKKRVADAVLDKEYDFLMLHSRISLLMGHRKEKDVGNVFGRGFSWDEALDAVADVYNGVRCVSFLTATTR